MRVKCVLCDTIHILNDNDLQAKRLRNRPMHTYMCKECDQRIRKKTEKRMASGNFHLYRSGNKEDEI